MQDSMASSVLVQNSNNVRVDALEADEGRVFLSGAQALVRLPIMQRRWDRLKGWNTAGLISGYRGSPLGVYDQSLWRSAAALSAHDIVFQPGLNEDLAATALWGAQMHKAFGATKAEGVFGIWYGKGPGVDRTGDVFRNANILGTSPKGGVLALAGDDHGAQSSMFPHQTDGIFQSVMMPILQPASVLELMTMGMAGIALSRFAGVWVAMKTITEVVESAGAFELPSSPTYRVPHDFEIPAHGLNWDPRIAWPSQRHELERRLVEERLPAVLAWARHNDLDKVVVGDRSAQLGIVAVGKAYLDVLQALRDLALGIDDLAEMGIALYKVGLSWPLETSRLTQFARALKCVLVVEEKRPIVEAQIKDALYHCPASHRPIVVGKRDADGRALLPDTLELEPIQIGQAILSQWALTCRPHKEIVEALSARLRALREKATARVSSEAARRPFFCAGCPHNRSTVALKDAVVGGGIGCHVMALSEPSRNTSTFCQMGGEGAQWIGAAPFSQTQHIFQNLGDGTYQHSGYLAIRAAVAAKTNITFKILYNDAVAMTGGQPTEGLSSPLAIARQVIAEGASPVVLLSDRPQKWIGREPHGFIVAHRDELERYQLQFRERAGVSVIIYDQVCASEKRRRAKRQIQSAPERRLLINEAVCEGCGDCSIQSNCIAIEPVNTILGVKRKINQAACNTDFSCVRGFCPSFVEIEGVRRKAQDPPIDELFDANNRLRAKLPFPILPRLSSGGYNIYVAGIGGMGVLTLGALLGLAAHLDGKSSRVLDFTGLAQKNGAVVSQVRIASIADEIFASRLGAGEVDLVIGADLVTAATKESLTKLDAERSRAVLSTDVAPTADIVRDRDASVDVEALLTDIRSHVVSSVDVDAHSLCSEAFGDAIAANTFLLGCAWQKGYVPIGYDAIVGAIEANGVAVSLNQRAFELGRAYAAGVYTRTSQPSARVWTLAEIVSDRRERLEAYQDAAYAHLYASTIKAVEVGERSLSRTDNKLSMLAAQTLYRVMAYKDEYEVARLHTEPGFMDNVRSQFASQAKVSVWLSPPLISRIDPSTGRPKKMRFGPWVFGLLRSLRSLKRLRGKVYDPFGWTRERQEERRLRDDVMALLSKFANDVTIENYTLAMDALNLAGEVRGYGPVKLAAMREYWEQRSRIGRRVARSQGDANMSLRV